MSSDVTSSSCDRNKLRCTFFAHCICFFSPLCCRLEMGVPFCTTGFSEWRSLELPPAWLTSMDQICTEDNHKSVQKLQVAFLFFMRLTSLPLSLSFPKLYSQCRRCPGCVGGARRGWLIQRSHAV